MNKAVIVGMVARERWLLTFTQSGFLTRCAINMVNSYKMCVIVSLLVREEWPHRPSDGREIIKIVPSLHLGRGRAHGNLSLPTCSTFIQRTRIRHLLSLVKSQVYLVSTGSYLQNEHHASQRPPFPFLVALCITSHHPSVAAITAVTV